VRPPGRTGCARLGKAQTTGAPPAPRPGRGGIHMTNARDIMHRGAECIQEDDTLQLAAEKMREHQIGALPICGEDDRLHGSITDRDIVVRCVAEGRDPRTTTAGALARGTPIWAEADTDGSEVMRMMTDSKPRRLP